MYKNHLLWRKRRGAPSYTDRIKALFGANLIAYWPMNELSGTTAIDVSGNGLNGAYTGVTLGQPGIGDGNTCPLFDGVGDYNDIYSAGLNAPFDGTEGALLIWVAILNAAVLSDGDYHIIAEIRTDVNNRIEIYSNNTTITFSTTMGGIDKDIAGTLSAANTVLKPFIINWSDTGNALSAWIGGAQVGATQTGIGTWVGDLASGRCRIGAEATSLSWKGYLAHALLLNRPMTTTEIASVSANP